MAKYKPQKNHPNALPHSQAIENRIVEGIKNYLTMQAILDSIQHMNNAPVSTSTLYKIYGPAIAEARFERDKYTGGAMRLKIQEGDSKMIEFAAKTTMGLNPSIKVQEVDEDEESKDSIATLARLLGKDTDD